MITVRNPNMSDTKPQGKREPPTADEIEAKRQKVVLPEGMSKNQWKKLQRQKKWEESKEQYKEIKREKKKAARVRQREIKKQIEENPELAATLDSNYHQLKKKKLPESQIATKIQVIMDCEFDDLMNNKEIVSMSNQITRSYSAKRHCDYEVPLIILSFNKNLKARFDKSVSQYKKWQNLDIRENATLNDILPPVGDEARDKVYYLTADTDNVLETLEDGYTYVIGGIVDKNRHKNLCVNKAKELGLKVGKLPIDKYIEMNGRQVLATSHVYELFCKWYEEGGDWKKAFDLVLPPRKVKKEGEENEVPEDDTNDDEKREDEDEDEGDDGVVEEEELKETVEELDGESGEQVEVVA